MPSILGTFNENVKIVPILSYTSGTADRNSEVIDGLGFNRCCVVVHLAAVAANAVTQIYAKSSDSVTDENTLSSGSNVADSAQSIADTDDNTTKYMDFKFDKRYAQLVVDKDGSNACAESAVAYLYSAKKRPVTQASGNTTVGEGTGAVVGEDLGIDDQGTI